MVGPHLPSSALAGYQQGQDWNSGLLWLISHFLLPRLAAPSFYISVSELVPFLLLAKKVYIFTEVTEDHTAPDAKESGSFQNSPYPAAGPGGKTLSKDIRTKAITLTEPLGPR